MYMANSGKNSLTHPSPYVLLLMLLLIAVAYTSTTAFNNPVNAVFSVIASYFLAFFLFKFFGKYFVFKKKAVFFDMGGVFTTGDYYTGEIKENPGVRKLIEKLKSNYKVGVLSNQNAEVYGLFDKKFGLRKLFDIEVVSGREGVKKPDLKIYKIAIIKTGLKAGDIAFVDDSSENVDAANKAGMKGILMTSVDDTKNKLGKLGYKI